jgi:hypothetical protein
MKKIPVGATIARAYRFAFGDFFRILGVMWPSLLLMWVPSILMQRQMTAISMQMAAKDYSGLQAMLPFFLIFYSVAFILIFMQMIGIAQIALERRKGPVWFYFWLGRPVWRLVGNVLLLIVALIIGWIAVTLAGVLIALLMGWLAKLAGDGILATIFAFLTVIVALVPFCALCYCVIRLSFLLVPVVAAEEQGFALARSWTLGLRNFWRMFLLLLATLGPFIVLELVFIFGFMFKGLPFPPSQASAAQKAIFEAAMNARMLEMMNAMNHYWYITYPLMVAVMVVFYGLCTGAQCFAYRALAEDEASAPIPAN